MKRTLTVFLCGTYSDLTAERAAVIASIEQMQAENDSMEFFGARPHPPLDTCLEEVRKSNVLVVIVGHRYGSFAPGLEVSFTEAEYTEGYRLNKPCLVYFRDRSVPVLIDDVEQDGRGIDALRRFRKTLGERHTVASFRGSEDLAQLVRTDLERALKAIGSAAHLQEGDTDEQKLFDTVHDLLREALDAGVGGATLLGSVRTAVTALWPSGPLAGTSVFLSYSTSDTAIVQQFADGLKRRGIKVWWAEERVLPGDNIVEQVARGLEEADMVAFFISSSSLGRQWVQYELSFAIAHRLSGSGGAVILPIRLDDVPVPSVLRDVRALDLRDGNVERGLDEMIRVIHNVQDTPRE